MSQDGSYKVKSQADSGGNAQQRPKNPQHEAQGASQFTSCKKRKGTQGKADDFVNYSHYTWITANLRDGGIGHHCSYDQCNSQIQV